MRKFGMLLVVFLCVLCFVSPLTVRANGNQAQTPHYNTDTNNVGANKIWEATKESFQEFQDEVNLLANILIAIFVIVGSIAFILNTIRISTMPNHPIQKRKLMIDVIMNISCVALLGGIFLLVKLIILTAVTS